MAITKVTNSVLTDGAVHTASLAADSVNGTKIANNAVDSEHITSGAIDTAHIADSQITTAKIADDAVTTAKVLDANVTTAKIADANITTAKLADDAVTAAKLASDVAGTGLTSTNGVLSVNATGASGLQDGAVSTVKIADDAVTADKLANSINTEIAANTAKTGITSAQASAITANTAKVTNATHTGDVTGSTALTIADDAVTIAKIADASLTTLSEGISNPSNQVDTQIPTTAAVADHVSTLGGLFADDGNFVVGDGSAFTVESGATARDSIGLGTSGHIQFHCLGVGQAASTNNGQIDATTLYASTNIGKDSGDYITWTTDTQMDFYVNGSNEMRLEADGDLHVDGDVIAASTTVSSDEKLKENIEKIENPLSLVNSMKGVNFNFIKGGKKSSGVIAQDIQKVMPHLVKEVNTFNSAEKHLAVDYNGLIGLLIESVKTLSEKVEKLENR